MKIKYLLFATIFIFTVAVIFSACSWTTGGVEIEFPEHSVSYMNHVQPFMQLNCARSGCHIGPTFAGGYSFYEYHHLMSAGIVVPGNPNGSRLVQILENRITHFTYFDRGYINDNRIKGIRTWIQEGAINN
jgi:hypothetical protein